MVNLTEDNLFICSMSLSEYDTCKNRSRLCNKIYVQNMKNYHTPELSRPTYVLKSTEINILV